MHRSYRRICLTIMIMVILAASAKAELPSEDQLSRQAESFLELMDQGRYDEAWSATSTLFQSLNDPNLWQARHHAVHAAYGTLAFRQRQHVRYRKTYNLSPDGLYVVVQFKSAYANKSVTTETVVLDCRNTPECLIREFIIR